MPVPNGNTYFLRDREPPPRTVQRPGLGRTLIVAGCVLRVAGAAVGLVSSFFISGLTHEGSLVRRFGRLGRVIASAAPGSRFRCPARRARICRSTTGGTP